jgi:hypothetical protein
MYSNELILFVSKFLEKDYPELNTLFKFLGEEKFGKFIKIFSGKTIKVPTFKNIFIDILSLMYLSFVLRGKNADVQLKKTFRGNLNTSMLTEIKNNALKIKTRFSNDELNKIKRMILWERL